MKTHQFLKTSAIALLAGLLISGCFDFASDESDDKDSGLDTGSDSDAEDTNTDSDTGSDSDAEDTNTSSDTGSDSDAASDSDTEDTGGDTDTCSDENCTQCTEGVCCDGDGHFKKDTDGSCAKATEYQCIQGVCGNNRQYRVVDVFCSGSSADCDGDRSDPEWIPLAACADNQICTLDDELVATCQTCGELQVCESGDCACEFESCLDECCQEGKVCHWTQKCGDKEFKVTASDGANHDYFGASVSLSGDRAIVGAVEKDYYKGAAYIFERDSNGDWLEQARLATSDGAANDNFGGSVSISSDRAIVSAPGKDSNKGAAYIFERDSNGDWLEHTKLTDSDGVTGDYFGAFVSLSGDRAIVSALGKDSNKGAAYIFERDSNGDWLEKTILTASDGAAGEYFGVAVAISGDRAIIGAQEKDGRTGAAYIFERDSNGDWLEKTILTASDGAAGEYFGAAVSLSDDRAMVGTPMKFVNKGAVYVFERNPVGDWLEHTILTASDGAETDLFGSAVSLSGDRAIVGAFYNDGSTIDFNGAYIFEYNSNGQWVELLKLTATNSSGTQMFGQSVSIDGDRVIVGASYDHENGTYAGSATIF